MDKTLSAHEQLDRWTNKYGGEMVIDKGRVTVREYRAGQHDYEVELEPVASLTERLQEARKNKPEEVQTA